MRPALLFLDTDVLLQLLIGLTAQTILSPLKKRYGVQPIIVPEVEVEVLSIRKFGTLPETQFRKAHGSGLIEIITENDYVRVINRNTDLRDFAAGTSYAQIQHLGRRYNLRVDRGEAYTHAMAASLGQPSASNDYSAVTVLDRAGERLPVPVCRTFDLVAFAHQVKAMTEKECDDFRQTLNRFHEHMPRCWEHASFLDGLRNFVPRLIDPTAESTAGRRPSQTAPSFAAQILLPPI